MEGGKKYIRGKSQLAFSDKRCPNIVALIRGNNKAKYQYVNILDVE